MIPAAAKLVKPNVVAVTLGLYNIRYDPQQIDLSSPTWDALGVIAEELSHGEQFIEMWQNLPNILEETNRYGASKSRRPNHDEALTSWYLKYSAATAVALNRGWDPYLGNEYEIGAIAKRANIMDDLKLKYPQHYANNQKICP